MNSVIVFAKYPMPGKVKTRLGKEIGYEVAANLYQLFLTQTFELVQKLDVQKVVIAVEPESKLSDFSNMVPNGFQVFPQRGQNLGARLIDAFDYVYSQGGQKVVALGSDSPTLPIVFIEEAFVLLEQFDVVLGPAEDGGYYLIGTSHLERHLFDDIVWSSNAVLQTTMERAKEREMTYTLLSPWYDVDDCQTLRRATQDDASGRLRAYVEKTCKKSVLG